MGEFYAQLAGISAVLAGFATTFLALLLAHQERGRILMTAMGVSIATATSLLVAALGWALLGGYATQITLREGPAALQEPPSAWLTAAHQSLSNAFMIGLLGLFLMLALSGWLRNRILGIFSTLCTLMAIATLWGVLRHVIS